jgi:hypothetical protein
MPEGWCQPQRRYCDTDCREAAGQARSCEQAKTPTVQDVLLSCARARIALRPDGTGGLWFDVRTTGLDPLVRRGLRIHEREVTATIGRAMAVVAFYDLPASLLGRTWLCCDHCGEARLGASVGDSCKMSFGCLGRLVVLVQPEERQ